MTTGAFQASWKGANPRDKFQEFIKAHEGDPDAALAASLEFFQSDSGKPYLPALIEYAFANTLASYDRLVKPKPAPKPAPKPTLTPEQIATREAAKAAALAAAQNAKVAIVNRLRLLSIILPNNKRLADCSGEELRQQGGWLKQVGEAVIRQGKPTVGTAYNEEELRKFYDDHQKKAA